MNVNVNGVCVSRSMKTFIGEEINVGDRVVAMHVHRSSIEPHYVIVTRLTDKTVFGYIDPQETSIVGKDYTTKRERKWFHVICKANKE